MKKLALLAAAAALTAAYFKAPERVPVEILPHVVTCAPLKKSVPRRLRLPGNVRPNQEVVLHARIQGYVESVAVDRGAKVRRGDVVAKLSVPEIEKELARQEAELALCVPMIARDQAELTARKAVWERLAGIAQKTPNLVRGEELEEVGGRHATAQAQLEVTKNREKVLRAAAERTRTLLEFATIRAPFDGYVTERWVDPGNLVQAGSTPLLRITQVDPVRVRVRVPESDALHIRQDTSVAVQFVDVPSKSFEGRVTRLFWGLKPKTRTMAVEIDVANPEGAIRPGMFANVALTLEQRAQALVLPATALVTELRRVMPAEKKPSERELAAEVVPNQEAAIHPRVQGYLETVPVDRGDRVKKGDVLAKIAVPDLEKELAQEEAELALQPLEVALDQAKLSWREAVWRRLNETASKAPGLVNRDVLDEARGAYEAAKAGLETSQARGAALRAALEKTRAMIELATLRAPFDAVVTERWVDPGHMAQPAVTKVLHLVQVDPVRVRFHLPQTDVAYILPECRARIEFPFADAAGNPIEAPLSRLYWSLNPETKTMSTEVDLPNPQGAIRPGMYARVRLEIDRPPAEGGAKKKPRPVEKAEHSVLVVRSGAVVKVPVEIGQEDGIEFEVRKGLSGDEEVIIAGKNLVSHGDRVRTTQRSP
jgi:RND family efflux transporter MFP subunit